MALDTFSWDVWMVFGMWGGAGWAVGTVWWYRQGGCEFWVCGCGLGKGEGSAPAC